MPYREAMRTNWAGNVHFGEIHRPSTVDELRSLVAASDQVRPVGTGHSFNDIAAGAVQVSTEGLPPVCDVAADGTVRVAGGLRYGDVVRRLDEQGWALANLGSLPHISIAGACATGTHGSGTGCLATSVLGLELVTADGSLRTVAPVAAVGLGGLGVVTYLTLRLVPTFELEQYVYDGLPLPSSDEELDELFSAGYSVSLFTRWTDPTRNQAWVKRRPGGPVPVRWLGGVRADWPRHPVPGMSPQNCTEQLGRPGPWYERLPHFRLEFTPSAGDELQSEYLVPRSLAVDALRSLMEISDRIASVLHVSELRTVDADALWLSPSYQRDSVAIHFTWISSFEKVAPVMREVETRLAPFAPRPHWGKLFGIPVAELRASYPRFADFVAMVDEYDPTGTFSNPWLDSLLRSA